MNDIKFSCPQCGQHLTVAAEGANATVACPQCGQAIVVPSSSLAMANLPAPKVPERRAAVAKKKSPLVMVAALALGVCLVGLALFVFREKIFKSTDYWTLDIEAVDTPDVPAGGKIHDKLFTAEEMHIANDALTLRTPQNPPEAGVTIALAHPMDILYGKTLLFGTNTPRAPGVLLRWKNPKGQKMETLIHSGYSLRLEFGNPEGDHVSGEIYLCVDDLMKDYVVGKFNAYIMPDPVSSP